MADWKDRMDSSIDNNTICAHCGEVYGEHFGMRCSNEGDGTTFVAASPAAPAGQAECVIEPWSSRACERGTHSCVASHSTTQPAAQSGGDWRIDASAGSEILVYKNCSVIEGEQAHWVLGLIKAAPPAQSAVTDEQIEAIGAKIYGTCFTPADRQFAMEVLALASSAQADPPLEGK